MRTLHPARETLPGHARVPAIDRPGQSTGVWRSDLRGKLRVETPAVLWGHRPCSGGMPAFWGASPPSPPRYFANGERAALHRWRAPVRRGRGERADGGGRAAQGSGRSGRSAKRAWGRRGRGAGEDGQKARSETPSGAVAPVALQGAGGAIARAQPRTGFTPGRVIWATCWAIGSLESGCGAARKASGSVSSVHCPPT